MAFLLAVVVVLGGITGCQKAASTRPTSTPEGDRGVTVPTTDEGSASEATVVSVVTPLGGETPAAEPSATAEPGGGTPQSVEPTATTEISVEPVATATDAPPTGSSSTITHVVKRGETLMMIAQQYGTTWQAIANENGITNPNQIYTGQRLTIPSDGSSSSGGSSSGCRVRHTVRSGEWVWQIARNYGVSPYDILALNGLTVKSANTIYPGKVLCIP